MHFSASQYTRKLIAAVVLAGALLLASSATAAVAQQPAFDVVLSDGQFVYGPNVGDFDVQAYLAEHAPHLSPYAEQINGLAAYYSINPKVYLTLLELSAGLISAPAPAEDSVQNPFRLDEDGLPAELEALSKTLTEAYYSRLYQSLPATYGIPTPSAIDPVEGDRITPGEIPNAASYAVAAALAEFQGETQIAASLDTNAPASFYQTYTSLFPGDDPLDASNVIATSVEALAVPSDMLQLPYTQGVEWMFGGVHGWSGGGTDMSSLDFMPPQNLGWGADTSNMWVVAASGGTLRRFSNCYVRITHTGGWETGYYHLENVQSSGGIIQANQRIGVIANTLAEAICSGGSSTGPHVHFGLMLNGAWVPLNGSRLSGWAVHSGSQPYDTNQATMWLERGGTRRYAWQRLLNDTCPPPTPTRVLDGHISQSQTVTFGWSGLSGCSFQGYQIRVKNTPNMDSGGTLIVNGLATGTEYQATIPPAWHNQTVYWGVRAANAPNGASWRVQSFRVIPGLFYDVPAQGKEWMQPWIESFYEAGITTGCAQNPLGYCPEREVTRAEMAVFIPRALNYPNLPYNPPDRSGTFNDMPVGGKEWMEEWVEQFYSLGITTGCTQNPLQYCPERQVTRAEMAVFILRAKYGGGYQPPAASGTFADLPVAGKEWMVPWIERFYAEGITTGCSQNPMRYCPERPVTRAEMAVFILRAFDGLPSP